jgi:hypothetical protein
MEPETFWQAFASTGNIYRYLDYKQAVQQPYTDSAGLADFVGESTDGDRSDIGSGSARDPL